MRRLLRRLLLLSLAAAAPPAVTIRTGDHDGFGRVVFDLPAGARAAVSMRDGALAVRLSGASAGAAEPPPRNVSRIDIRADEVVLTLRQGAGWREVAADGKLVLDVLDSAAPTGKPEPEQPAPLNLFSGPAPRPHSAVASQLAAPPAAHAPPAVHAPQPYADGGPPLERPKLDRLEPPAAEPPAAEPAPAPPPAPAPASPPTPPAEIDGAPLALGASIVGQTLCLPFAPTTGAAAFRRGGDMVAVFDERRPLDLAPLLSDPVFASARVQLLPTATVLRMALPPAATLRLTRNAVCWLLTAVADSAAGRLTPIHAEAKDGKMLIAAAAASHVVSVPDPETGGALLAGTQTQAGQGVPLTRRTPEFTLLASVQGIAAELASDGLSLHTAAPGFVLDSGASRALVLEPPGAEMQAAAEAAQLTRRWDFPGLPQDALLRRLQAATAAAAAAAPRARTASRLAAVQAELALGLGAEAQALATLARTDDARTAETPDAAALDAVAALLAGRTQDSAALDDARLNGTDEVALWRAVRAALQTEGAPDAAAVFAATAPLIQAYPQALRQKLLPLAAETMALGGEHAAAHRLLDARPGDASLDYARAVLDETEGHGAPSLAVLDRLAQSPDRLLRARAAIRAVEQRLRNGELTAAAAATALDKLIFAWRGDDRELSLRLRVAALRGQSGKWRAALMLLRETAGGDLVQTPAAKAMLRQQMASTFAQALAQDASASLPPLELVALVEENPDLLPANDAGRDLAARLAARLATLDLPRRAMTMLEKLLDSTPPGSARAEIGAHLAALRLEQGDAGGALMALSASAAPALPSELEQRRTISFARATAQQGNLPPALAALAAIDTPDAEEARAGLLEDAKHWPDAVAALQTVAARAVPSNGPLNDPQARLLLRLASAAAQAGDESLLARLRLHDAPRLPPGKLADMFRLLTQEPVAGVADLPRAAREAAQARNLPAALASLAALHAP